ncbi:MULTISPECIES: hypothetical protein [unclassified Paenibacillus]|uniref:hypothetical protein n=1 Tax=unclassified Paenibacillus TaxID=185978 RepID=UPI002404A512|nr:MULTISPECIES: hypothetical protein [unclassified Paenibacillus]MDF9840785.1 hypothetical protein [Paenibacillus sp. PastF-2]MDF9847368.1 hypothetical protein [Paenibacillus sp. PastM-2]MDF9854054.1 hypothetical protein [Paenibacillus sp. PastF-1]MDH6479327.1 hypothetical protein [Paenibacillus sp. PastH-2]MDH6506940.1 hypothetical protein [Paenibacillus sp. PastM-3]
MTNFRDQLIARYKFDDAANAGKVSSGQGQGQDGTVSGKIVPAVCEVGGRTAAKFAGGPGGTSYIQLPGSAFLITAKAKPDPICS